MPEKKYPEITIKGLKTGNIMGMEGPQSECSVYLDGKRFCIAVERGDGGPLDFQPLPNVDYTKKWGKRFYDVINGISEKLKEHHPKDKQFPDLDYDFDLKVGVLMEQESYWKDIQRSTKKSILGYDEKKKAFYTWGTDPTEVYIKMFRSRNPEIRLIINELPKSEAIQAYRDPQSYLRKLESA